jgi:hypothetical protein
MARLELLILQVVEANRDHCHDQVLQRRQPPSGVQQWETPVQFPVPLAPKTRERIVTRRESSNGKASNFNRRSRRLCFGKGEVESSIPSSSTI